MTDKEFRLLVLRELEQQIDDSSCFFVNSDQHDFGVIASELAERKETIRQAIAELREGKDG